MQITRILSALLLIVACSRSVLAADQYWAYSYEQISVTAQGNADFAKTLAHNLYRLNLSIAAALHTAPSTWHEPTNVYAVPGELFTAFSGLAKDLTSVGAGSSFKTTLLINTSTSAENRYWGAYYAFTSGVLGTAYSFRYPPWFISGLCEFFAASAVDPKRIIIGGISPGRVYTLSRGTWIPLQMLLSVREHDPQMASQDFNEMYDAESWYLVHKIVIDQFHSSNFFDYFNLLDKGDDESKAFSSAFTNSYEEIDKELKQTIAGGKFMQMKVSIVDVEDAAKPVKLSEAEAKGRLALYAAEHGVQPAVALTLASAALKLEPGTADARAAKVRAELRSADLEEALRDANEMCAGDTASLSVAETCAFAYVSLSHKGPETASPVASPAELAAKARKYYEIDLQLQPDDLQSWYGLAQLTNGTHDKSLANALLPRILPVQTAHPRVGRLAGAVAGLYSITGDSDSAMKYARLWQQNAFSGADRSMAATYISRLKGALDRKHAAGGDAVPN